MRPITAAYYGKLAFVQTLDGLAMKKFILVSIGMIGVSLGVLWFLQGADLIRIKPILCFADCAYVTGGSKFWEAIGALVFIVGILIIGIAFKREIFRTRRTFP